MTPSDTCSSGYTYLWSTNPQQTTQTAINLYTGIYTVTVTCGTDTVTAVDTVGYIPVTNCSISNIQNCNNGQSNGSITISVTGGKPPYFYMWNTSQMTPTVTGLPVGTYTCTVTDAVGCVCTASGTIIDNSSIINNAKNDFIQIIPNPTTGKASIDISNLNETNFVVEITDELGRMIYLERLNNSVNKSLNIDITAFPRGLYFLKFYNKNKVYFSKIIKE